MLLLVIFNVVYLSFSFNDLTFPHKSPWSESAADEAALYLVCRTPKKLCLPIGCVDAWIIFPFRLPFVRFGFDKTSACPVQVWQVIWSHNLKQTHIFHFGNEATHRSLKHWAISDAIIENENQILVRLSRWHQLSWTLFFSSNATSTRRTKCLAADVCYLILVGVLAKGTPLSQPLGAWESQPVTNGFDRLILSYGLDESAGKSDW